jgi:DNA-binding MarR family transcriptional regulator
MKSTNMHDSTIRDATRQFILFAAAIRYATSGETLSKKIGLKITDAQADALRFLALNDNVTIGQISVGLGHTISGATKSVNRLEKNGWVSRHNGGEDHRSVYVQLTEAGKAITKALLVETEERMQRILSNLRPDTVERMNQIIKVFLRDFIDSEHTASNLCVACGFEGGFDCVKTDTDCVVAQTIKDVY